VVAETAGGVASVELAASVAFVVGVVAAGRLVAAGVAAEPAAASAWRGSSDLELPQDGVVVGSQTIHVQVRNTHTHTPIHNQFAYVLPKLFKSAVIFSLFLRNKRMPLLRCLLNQVNLINRVVRVLLLTCALEVFRVEVNASAGWWDERGEGGVW
jgi:hypothetical protein